MAELGRELADRIQLRVHRAAAAVQLRAGGGVRMGLISGLLTLPLAPVRGTVWIAEQVLEQAEREYYDEGAIQAAAHRDRRGPRGRDDRRGARRSSPRTRWSSA